MRQQTAMTWSGLRIREARARRGWTQRDLAHHLGASLRSVAAWERDEARPQAHWLVKLDQLFDESPTETPAEPTPAEPTPAGVSGAPSLKGATVMELLAELATRFAHAEAHPGAEPLGQPFERVRWRSADAPSAHGGPVLSSTDARHATR